jgi:hypothetical protein
MAVWWNSIISRQVAFKLACISAIHSSVNCQTTGPQPLPQRFLHLMRSRASSFKSAYPLLSPRSSSRFLRLLPRLLLTSIRPCNFPSITSFRRQFLRKIWPIQLVSRFITSCRIFLCSLTQGYHVLEFPSEYQHFERWSQFHRNLSTYRPNSSYVIWCYIVMLYSKCIVYVT